MDTDLTELDEFLASEGVDGYLFDDDESNTDQYYLTGFGAPDAFVTLYTPEETAVLVSGLEYGRAKKEARADTVARHSDYDYSDRVAEHGPVEGRLRVIADFLADRDVESVAVGAAFPTGTADGLREHGISVSADHDGVIGEIRAVKTDAEIDHLKAAQRANERAMAVAEGLLAAATVEGGTLHRDGEPLTAEFVKQEIEIALLREGCALDDTIVAGGAQGADPHERGSGPLPAGEPIVVDIFPRSKETKYFADMTRTFVKGEPSDTAREWYDLTLAAQEAAFDAIEPGVTGEAVHEAVCAVYHDAGEPTLLSEPTTETGFIHGTGHGLGLDIHEGPRINPSGGELKPGHVVTVEPGLYDPAVGGVRIEDVVVITEDGFENITDYEKSFVLD